MPDENLKQKLTAILNADVKDYSRLMSQDRVGTIDTLKSHRSMLSEFIRKYGGRVIDNPGDECLAAFESVSDAVNCSVEIQRELAERNAEVPSARMMQWRIGISLGEVIKEEGRIYGDGVNIAARVQGLAEPGGICISGTAYDHVKDKLGLEYDDLGKQKVKNIPDPVRVYRVLSFPGTAAHRVTKAKADLKKAWRSAALIISAVIAVGIGSVLIWNYISQRESPPAKVAVAEKVVLPTEKPSIAVLPFDNMSGDAEQEYFSDGIAEDILNGLAKNPNLNAIARTSSFRFRDQNQDIRDIGRQLNVTHILEGSVRRSGNRIRVTAQLINASDATHLWSEQYDRELTDVFRVQDGIKDAILMALNVFVGQDRENTQTTDVEAYSAYLLGLYHSNLQELDKASESFERAIALDPSYADAYAELAYATYSLLEWGRYTYLEKLPLVNEYIDRALALDPDQQKALMLRGNLRFYKNQEYQDAITELSELIRKRPRDPDLLYRYATIMQTIGLPQLALKIFARVLEIDPLDPGWHVMHGLYLLRLGRFNEARSSIEKAAEMGLDEPVFMAELAFYEGDAHTLQRQVDVGQVAWGNASWQYPGYRVGAAYLNGEHTKVRELLLSLKGGPSSLDPVTGYKMALLEGDFSIALDYYRQSKADSPHSLFDIRTPPWFPPLFPDFQSHSKYQALLRDLGLDKESVDKLKIPPLPF